MATYTWQITSQQTGQTVLDAAGNVIQGSYVYYTTGQGNQGVIFIPDNLRTTKYVAAQVAAQAKLLDDIGNLTGSSNS
jgi:hypothetical protein